MSFASLKGEARVLAAVTVFAVFGEACSPAPIDPPGRILLVSMDTVRADRVSGFGDASTTPTILEIANEGVRFPHFYAASTFTIPSHMSIFTGLDPVEHGVYRRMARLSPKVVTLAEILAANGYRTAAFHEGGYMAPRFGFDQGFERYLAFDDRKFETFGNRLSKITDWMRELGDEAYFLFLHSYSAHYPYGGLESYRRKHPERGIPSDAEISALREKFGSGNAGGDFAGVSTELKALCTLINQLFRNSRGLLACGERFLPGDFPSTPHAESDLRALLSSYDARIGVLDAGLRHLRKTLVDLGQWDDTLLIITSDHGEAFFEHGLYQHGFIPYEEVLRVPLVISYPRLLREGAVRSIDGLAWHLDLLPTILRLAGLEEASRRHSRPGIGMDLTSAMLGHERIPKDRTLYPAVLELAYREPQPVRRAALRGHLKYIEGHAAFGNERQMLFDLVADPEERVSLVDSNHQDLESLEHSLSRYTEALSEVPPLHQVTGSIFTEDGEIIEIPEKELEQLRALGYAD